MIMADILFWFLVIVGVYVVLIAYWLGAAALFPAAVERCSQAYGRRPVAATFLGLAVGIPALLIAVAVAKALPHPLVGVIATGAMMVPTLFALAGSAGLAARIGAGLPSPLDTAQPWRRVLRGGVVLGLLFVMPVLGWFVLLPWAMISGLGVALMSRRRVEARSQAPASVQPPARDAAGDETIGTMAPASKS